MAAYSQGSVFYGLRSFKYDNNRCYGVIITARCDIAQKKAKILHVLSALSQKDWIKTELFSRAIHSYLCDILDPIRKWAQEKNLHYDTLIKFGPQNVLVNINADKSINSRQVESLKKSVYKWDELLCQLSNCCKAQKDSLLDNELKSYKSDILRQMIKGGYPNDFCFIPDCARLKDGSMLNGLVVDLKDIIQIDPFDLDTINKFGLDYSQLKTNEEGRSSLCLLNQKFHLSADDDVVVMVDSIKSPWIEYLMQRFSNSFVRIGVDSPSDSDLLEYCRAHRMSN